MADPTVLQEVINLSLRFAGLFPQNNIIIRTMHPAGSRNGCAGSVRTEL
jgi:hypothetical protein